MSHQLVWQFREQVADLARYYDPPSPHAEILSETRDALDAWLALMVAEDPVPDAVLNAAKRSVIPLLVLLTCLSDFPDAREIRDWTQSLTEAGLLLLPGEDGSG